MANKQMAFGKKYAIRRENSKTIWLCRHLAEFAIDTSRARFFSSIFGKEVSPVACARLGEHEPLSVLPSLISSSFLPVGQLSIGRKDSVSIKCGELMKFLQWQTQGCLSFWARASGSPDSWLRAQTARQRRRKRRKGELVLLLPEY